jgi:hypothetical protein
MRMRSWWLCWALAGTPLVGAELDVVVLDNRQSLQGTVVEDPAHPELVVIKTATGRLSIRRERIVSIVPSLGSRLAQVPADDLTALIELGRQCRAKGRNAEALEALEKAMALVRGDPKLLTDLSAAALYLRLVDEIRGPEAALPLYRWYRSLGGVDPATIARLQALEAVAGTAPGTGTLPPLPAPTAPDPAAAGGLLSEGLELRSWAGESAQWSNPVETRTVPLTGKDALKGVRQALEVSLPAPDKNDRKGKAAIRRPVNRSCEESHLLGMRLKNTGETPLQVALAVKTGDWVFYESTLQTVKPGEGWKVLRFDLKEKTFKSKASNWANSAAVEYLDDVKEIQVIFYNRDQEGSCLISSMKFLGEDEL